MAAARESSVDDRGFGAESTYSWHACLRDKADTKHCGLCLKKKKEFRTCSCTSGDWASKGCTSWWVASKGGLMSSSAPRGDGTNGPGEGKAAANRTGKQPKQPVSKGQL